MIIDKYVFYPDVVKGVDIFKLANDRARPTFVRSRRRLGMYNAGSSTELGAYRVFEHCAGRILAEPQWQVAAAKAPKRLISRNVVPALQHAVRQLRAPFL